MLTIAFVMTSQWLAYMKTLPNSQLPPTISTSYADNEQTGNNDTIELPVMLSKLMRFVLLLVPVSYAVRVCQEFATLSEPFHEITFPEPN